MKPYRYLAFAPLLGYLLLLVALATGCATSRERRRIETRAYYDKRQVSTDTTVWPVKNDAASYGRPPLAPIPPRSFEVQRPAQHIGELQEMVNTPVVTMTPHRSVVDKVLGRNKPPVIYTAPTAINAGKKSQITINQVKGNQSNSTTKSKAAKNAVAGTGATSATKAKAPVAQGPSATSTGKAKAPLATGTGDATDQSGTGAASTVKGNGNAPVLTNTAPEAPGVGATIARYLSQPIGIVAALAAAGGLVWLVLWLRRGKKAADTV